MKNNSLLYFKIFILVCILSSNLVSCYNNDDDEDNELSSVQGLTQIMYSINDIKSFNLYSPTSFKFYPWTINTTVYPGVSFPDNTVVKINSNLSWSSSNENIIKSVDGIIVALNEGEATLSAKWNISNLSTSAKLTVALPDSSTEDYRNWQFNDIDTTKEIAATYYYQDETHNYTTIYWNDLYYLTTAYVIAYSSDNIPTNCTEEEENKTIIELDLSKNNLQEDGIEVDQNLKSASMYQYTIKNLDRSVVNYVIICKKQTLSIPRNNFSVSRLTSGSRFYLPIKNNN